MRCHVHFLTGVGLHLAFSLAEISVHIWWRLLHHVFCRLQWYDVRWEPLDLNVAIFAVCGAIVLVRYTRASMN